jgi:hypothetical protein
MRKHLILLFIFHFSCDVLSAKEKPLFIRASQKNMSTRVGDTVTLRYTLYAAVNFSDLKTFVTIISPNYAAYSHPISRRRTKIEILNGKAYKVMRLSEVKLIPSVAGVYEVSPYRASCNARRSAIEENRLEGKSSGSMNRVEIPVESVQLSVTPSLLAINNHNLNSETQLDTTTSSLSTDDKSVDDSVQDDPSIFFLIGVIVSLMLTVIGFMMHQKFYLKRKNLTPETLNYLQKSLVNLLTPLLMPSPSELRVAKERLMYTNRSQSTMLPFDSDNDLALFSYEDEYQAESNRKKPSMNGIKLYGKKEVYSYESFELIMRWIRETARQNNLYGKQAKTTELLAYFISAKATDMKSNHIHKIAVEAVSDEQEIQNRIESPMYSHIWSGVNTCFVLTSGVYEFWMDEPMRFVAELVMQVGEFQDAKITTRYAVSSEGEFIFFDQSEYKSFSIDKYVLLKFRNTLYEFSQVKKVIFLK